MVSEGVVHCTPPAGRATGGVGRGGGTPVSEGVIHCTPPAGKRGRRHGQGAGAEEHGTPGAAERIHSSHLQAYTSRHTLSTAHPQHGVQHSTNQRSTATGPHLGR